MSTATSTNVNLSNSPTTDELVTAVETLVNEVQELKDENESLREEVKSLRADAARERADIRSDVTEVRETVENTDDGVADGEEPVSNEETPTPNDGEKTDVPDAETSLEQTIRLPEHVADDALTANEQRARSVAKDIQQYADHNHQYGNYSLTATTLRKVLTAQSDDGSVHHQTVKRVRNFLERLGDTEVSVVEDTGGTKRLVFNDDLVERIQSWSDAHSGVRHETVGGGIKT